jgi:hypothetical protein
MYAPTGKGQGPQRAARDRKPPGARAMTEMRLAGHDPRIARSDSRSEPMVASTADGS